MKLNQKIIDASSKLMDTLTKRYYWYHDTPEQPFEYTEGSIWLINSETGQWMLVLEKPGFLWYYNGITDTFFKYLNMKYPDFDSFIKIWVEDNLQREVVLTGGLPMTLDGKVKDVLENGNTIKI
jgi:hypothetical protein